MQNGFISSIPCLKGCTTIFHSLKWNFIKLLTSHYIALILVVASISVPGPTWLCPIAHYWRRIENAYCFQLYHAHQKRLLKELLTFTQQEDIWTVLESAIIVANAYDNVGYKKKKNSTLHCSIMTFFETIEFLSYTRCSI